MIILEKEKWVNLIYDGIYFGDRFQISETGNIRNNKTKKCVTQKVKGLKLYSFIFYNKRTYRIDIGEAQVQSGLEQTVFDTIKGKRPPFDNRQLRYLDMYYQRIPLEEPLD